MSKEHHMGGGDFLSVFYFQRDASYSLGWVFPSSVLFNIPQLDCPLTGCKCLCEVHAKARQTYCNLPLEKKDLKQKLPNQNLLKTH